MKKTPAHLSAAAILLSLPVAAMALSAAEVYEKVASSVVVVEAFKDATSVVALGSGVIVRREEVITNCHILVPGDSADVLVNGRHLPATLSFADVERDLCLLRVPSLSGSVCEIGTVDTLKPGARVYAIGAPQGLELTISEGLVSGLRTVHDYKLIQTSAPISPGSSGGGLFDQDGRLVGITTFTLKESQNINFALPADWVTSIWQRADLARARKERRVDDPVNPRLVRDAGGGASLAIEHVAPLGRADPGRASTNRLPHHRPVRSEACRTGSTVGPGSDRKFE